jgi:phosphoribosyl 1,2-cyclic phosphodiesterase
VEVNVLASGSTGNAVCIRAGETRILIDGGISTRSMTRKLADIGIDAASVDAVLVTHEHQDHTKGLVTFGKKYNVPIYARYDAWRAMPNVAKAVPQDNRRILRECLEVGECKIEVFDTSHDAVDPVGFNIFYNDRKFSLATDLGCVSSRVKNALTGADMLVFEANHDVDMLKKGSYPAFLKRRILSSRGHLSNEDAGQTLAEIIKDKSHTQVVLAHLSQENNCPQLAKTTVQDILQAAGIALEKEVSVKVASPDATVSWQIKRM